MSLSKCHLHKPELNIIQLECLCEAAKLMFILLLRNYFLSFLKIKIIFKITIIVKLKQL